MSSKPKVNHKAPVVQLPVSLETGIPLPLDEFQEFRAIEAEIQLIQLQVEKAIIPLQFRKQELISTWNNRYGIEDSVNYDVDFRRMILVQKRNTPVVELPGKKDIRDGEKMVDKSVEEKV